MAKASLRAMLPILHSLFSFCDTEIQCLQFCALNHPHQTRYALGRSHNAAELLRAEIYSPIICGCLLLHLNSTHSVSSGSFASSRTRLCRYSTDRIAMVSLPFSINHFQIPSKFFQFFSYFSCLVCLWV